jgi:hypothetical protein
VNVFLQVRWVDEAVQPLSDWQTVKTAEVGRNDRWEVWVDRQGKALILSFSYPPTIGPPPEPSLWKFTARWMGPSGPLSDAFEPVAPIYRPFSRGMPVLFAQWGDIVPLVDGGFAMFHILARPQDGGSISPAGWYALYPSGEARTAPTPAWLESYDGSLQLLSGGAGYAATMRDPNTCARAAEIIGPSGRLCFTLPLEGSEVCGSAGDTFSADGTFVLQHRCEFRWWPGLARPNAVN